jgi:hypothetical protein
MNSFDNNYHILASFLSLAQLKYMLIIYKEQNNEVVVKKIENEIAKRTRGLP